jgi:hypothetical protein
VIANVLNIQSAFESDLGVDGFQDQMCNSPFEIWVNLNIIHKIVEIAKMTAFTILWWQFF